MANTEKKMFRKSFIGGFSKEDVNKYIAEASEKYNEEKKELEAKLAAEEQKARNLSADLTAANSKIETLSKDSEELAVLREKYASLEKALAEKTEEAEKLTFENGILKKKEEALSAVEQEYSARKTELADIEISARTRAGEIVAEAETNAARIKSDLERTLFEKKCAFENEKKAILSETGDTVGAVTRLLAALKTEVESMDIKILRMNDSLRTGILSISDAVTTATDKVDSATDRLKKACEENN